MDVQMLVALVISNLKFYSGKFSVCVLEQDLINLLSTDLVCRSIGAKIDSRFLIAAATKERDRLDKYAAGKRADHALLNLRTIDSLKWEEVSTEVVKYLNSIAVERVHLIAQFDKCHNRIGVCFRRAIFKWVDLSWVI